MLTGDGVLANVPGLNALEDGFRVRRIRERLLHPTLEERLAWVRARYRRVYTLAQLRAAALARRGQGRPCSERGFMKALDGYDGPISSDALLRYDDALETGSFAQFWVVTPAVSRRDQGTRWMLGELRGGRDLYAIVARWNPETRAALGKGPRARRRPSSRSRVARRASSGALVPRPASARRPRARRARPHAGRGRGARR
jgi:hypothetical protein